MAGSEAKKWESRVENDESYRRELSMLFKNLRSIAISNMEYFQDSKNQGNQNHGRFYTSFHLLHEHLDRGIEPAIEYLLRIAHMYDVDEDSPGNGYRSVVTVVHKCCLHILQLSRHITVNKESFLFRGSHYSKELESFVTTLGQIRAIIYYLQKLVPYCGEGVLFPNEDNLSSGEFSDAESLMIEVESLSQETFYGRCLAFQFCESMRKPLTTINLVQASYSEGWDQHSTVMRLASSVVGSRKYVLDPDMRGQQVVNVTRNGDIKFCKAFWSIAESDLMHNLPLFVCPPVQMNKVISIDPTTFDLPLTDGSDMAKITPPCAHTGPAPVLCRLLSTEYREGQEWLMKNIKKQPPKIEPKSTGLVIHCHGGGFVAQSSASHQVYLRSWCKETNVPFLSIDYSLAPEAPFPRQLEEVFYAYCWALKNPHKLGTTAERVVVCGDSAGGNLAVSVAMRAASFGIRVPDAVVSVYGCMLVKYTPSPSRVLSLMDPLLPIGIVSKCLAAYAGMSHTAVFGFPASTANQGQRIAASAPNSSYSSPTSDTPKEPSFKGHKQTGSGDSGFHDDIVEKAKEGAAEDECGEQLAEVNLESSAVDLADSETTPPVNANAISDLVDKIKEGANDIDEEQGPGSAPDTAEKSKLSLDLGNMFRRRKTPERTHMTKSESTPVFHSPIASPMSASPSVFGATPTYAKTRHFAQSPVQHFKHMPIAKNPYMSPQLAKDELLAGLPPVHLIACHLCPMLDDSVMFAKRLKALGKEVHLEFINDLPHGFLNFVLVSQDAKKGSETCVKHLQKALQVNTSPPTAGNALFSLDDVDDEHWEVINPGAASVN